MKAATASTPLLDFRRLPAEAIAVIPESGEAWSFARLQEVVGSIADQFLAIGLANGMRIGLLLDPGVPSAIGFLAAGVVGSVAPLNPASRPEDIAFYLADLEAQAVLVSPRLTKLLDDAGVVLPRVVMESDGKVSGATAAVLRDELRATTLPDEKLVLHTSGTTARPKMVPLSSANLRASVENIVRSLALRESDRSLCVMPLFHIHGLMAGLLAPLSTGASAVIPGGFDAFKFDAWIEAFRPSYYSAVPTMHQMVLKRGTRPQPSSLRFVRSSSSPLSAATAHALEVRFGVPVLEAYGMTEAAHQIASNPLPPEERRYGSVGRGVGVEITILDDDGNELQPGETGEVGIRGPNVTSGYWANPAANATAFAGSWFRTGDQGQLDADGFLTLTGRLKEIINRGGEKVSPREIDDELLKHPGVDQAVAFAIPDPTLGEAVGVAVVPRDGFSLTEPELRRYLRERLAPFKVPRSVVILGEIPKGATGKVQRVGLAAKLGLGR